MNSDNTIIPSDLFLSMLKATANKTGKKGFQFDAQERFPLKNGAFDVVVANHMLYLLGEIDQTLKEISRVIKPNGRLIASTSGQSHLEELYKMILGENALAPYRPFNLENGGNILKKYFEVVETRIYKDSWIIKNIYDVELLYNYAQSVNLKFTEGKNAEQLLRAFKQKAIEKIEKNGYIKITKKTGLFIANKLKN